MNRSTLALCLLFFAPAYSFEEHYQRAQQYESTKQWAGAVEEYTKALCYKPEHISTLYKLGYLHYLLEQFGSAAEYFDKALQKSPANTDFLKAKGLALYQFGDYDQSAHIFEQLQSINPNDRTFDHKLWMHYMRKADFTTIAQHWPYQQSPWYKPDVAGKKVLIRFPSSSYGFGDIFMRIAYAQQLKELGAHIIIETKKSLVSLIKQSPYIDQVITVGNPLPAYDVEFTLERETDVIFAQQAFQNQRRVPYLFAAPQLIQFWKERLTSHSTFNIGICWHSQVMKDSAGTIKASGRSVPLELFASLSNIPNVHLYSLQKGYGTEQMNAIPFSLHDFGSDFDTQHGAFMDTAAIMSNLDLVITVDTSIAHLAGALGVPVWVMLHYGGDWRWFEKRSDSPWYPTMKLFRQPVYGDWNSVIDTIKQELILLQ